MDDVDEWDRKPEVESRWVRKIHSIPKEHAEGVFSEGEFPETPKPLQTICQLLHVHVLVFTRLLLLIRSTGSALLDAILDTDSKAFKRLK